MVGNGSALPCRINRASVFKVSPEFSVAAAAAATKNESTASSVIVPGRPFSRSSRTNSNGDDDSGLPRVEGKGRPPEEPPAGLCCMSGCANCVWLEHAQELIAYYDDGGDKAEEALNKIKDPSLKAFLKMELQSLKPK